LIFLTTSTFRSEFNLLTKRSDSGYSNCKQDILDAFDKQSFDDISARHNLLRVLGNIKVIKIRIPNSNSRQSAAAGYRLIILCNKNKDGISDKDHVAFLSIYPKRGKHGKIDLTPSEFKLLLKNYQKELEEKKLRAFEVDNQPRSQTSD
jgi:hypothetical protein